MSHVVPARVYLTRVVKKPGENTWMELVRELERQPVEPVARDRPIPLAQRS